MTPEAPGCWCQWHWHGVGRGELAGQAAVGLPSDFFFLYCYFTPVCSKTALMSSVCQVCCAFRKGTHCVCLRHLALAAPWQNFSCLLHLLGRGPYNSSSFFPDFSSIFSMCCVRQDVWGGFSLSVTISTEPSGNLLSQPCASKSRHLCALLSQVGVLKQLIK